MNTDDERAGGADNSRRTPTIWVVIVSLIAFMGLQFLVFGVSRSVLLYVAAIPLGALLWKVPPFEVPHEGKFWRLTSERFNEAASAAAKPAAGVAFAALVLGLLFAMATRRDVLDTVISFTETGGVAGVVVGAFLWMASRVLADAEILRANQRDSENGKAN